MFNIQECSTQFSWQQNTVFWECTANNWYLSTIYTVVLCGAKILLFHIFFVFARSSQKYIWLDFQFTIWMWTNATDFDSVVFHFVCCSFFFWHFGSLRCVFVCKYWPSASQLYLIYSTAVVLQICFVPFLPDYVNFKILFPIFFIHFVPPEKRSAAEREFIRILNVCYELRSNLNFFSFILSILFACKYGIHPMEIRTQVKDKWQRLVLCLLSFSYSWIYIHIYGRWQREEYCKKHILFVCDSYFCMHNICGWFLFAKTRSKQQ